MNEDFVNYVWPHALAASEQTGVDARLIAGQIAVETGWGQHYAGNNLAGIKAGAGMPSVTANTREIDGNGQSYRTDQAFRSFPTPGDSISGKGGYGDFINTNPRYRALQAAGAAGDFAGQLTALQRSGYSPDPNYASAVGQAAMAIDGVVKKGGKATWSNGANARPGTLADALPYTATATQTGGPAVATSKPKSTTDDVSDDDLLRVYAPKIGTAAPVAAAPATSATVTPDAPAAIKATPVSDDDLLKLYGHRAAPATTTEPAGNSALSLEATRAAIPEGARGAIEMMAGNRNFPNDLAAVSIKNIAAASGADPADLQRYFQAYKARPVSTSDAAAEGIRQGVSLGTGPAIGAAIEAASPNGRPFAPAMASRVADLKAAEAAHPYATMGGEVAGSLLPLMAGGATTLGARALGLTGENLLTRGMAGGATNMLIGATDAGIRSGGDLNETGKGAIGGAIVGAAAPVLGKYAGLAANKLYSAVGSPFASGRAENQLLTAITNAGETPGTVRNMLTDNPRLALMDVNPGAQEIAKGLATTPGQPSATLNRAYQARAATAGDATTGAFDAALGAQPDVKAVVDGLKATARTNAQRAFGEALADAKPVDVSSVIKAIDDRVSPGINGVLSQDANIPRGPVADELLRLKAKLTDGTANLTDANRLHAIQSEIRTTADTLGNSANGQDRLTANALRDVRGTLVDAIDNATGGKFKPAQRQFADDKAVEDAFGKGLDVFRNRAGVSGLEDRPEYWRAAIKDMSPDELSALRQGVRTAADQKIGAARNGAGAGQAIADSDFNVSKLSAILGDKEAGTLAKRLADEQKIAGTNRILFEGTQTEPRRQAGMATAVRNLAPLSMEIGLPSFAALTDNHLAAGALAALAAARRGASYLGQRSDLARNNALASMVSASGQDAMPVMNALQNRLIDNANAGQGFGRGVNLLTDAMRPAINPLLKPMLPAPTGADGRHGYYR